MDLLTSQIFGKSLVIVVSVTLIWQKAVAAMYINNYKTILALFRFGGQTKNRQTTKLKSSPNKLRTQYIKGVEIMQYTEI